MAEFHNIKVADIYKETKDCVVITFDIPAKLKDTFKFKQGQHLSVAFLGKISGLRYYLLWSGCYQKTGYYIKERINFKIMNKFIILYRNDFSFMGWIIVDDDENFYKDLSLIDMSFYSLNETEKCLLIMRCFNSFTEPQSVRNFLLIRSKNPSIC